MPARRPAGTFPLAESAAKKARPTRTFVMVCSDDDADAADDAANPQAGSSAAEAEAQRLFGVIAAEAAPQVSASLSNAAGTADDPQANDGGAPDTTADPEADDGSATGADTAPQAANASTSASASGTTGAEDAPQATSASDATGTQTATPPPTEFQ